MVFAVELFEAAWQRIGDGHGIEQTAAGEIERVEPGYDAAEHGDGQKDEADGADGDQILLVGSLGVVLLDDMGHQAEVVLHQAVAGRQVSPAPPLQTFPLLLPGQGAGKRPGISGQVQRQKQAVGQQQQSRR